MDLHAIEIRLHTASSMEFHGFLFHFQFSIVDDTNGYMEFHTPSISVLFVCFTRLCFDVDICLTPKFRFYSLGIEILFKISFQNSMELILIKTNSSMELPPEVHGTF